MKKSYNSSTPMIVGMSLFGIVVAAGVYTLLKPQEKTTNATTSNASVAPSNTSTAPASSNPAANNTTPASSSTPTTNNGSGSAVASAQKDGTYSASVDYSVPKGGENTIAVTLTIKDGTVTAVSTRDSYSDHESSRYISNFKNGVSGAVVGKSLSNVSPYKIGGASLTTSAFNRALSSIKQQAS